jgi:hypothetical protein
MIKVLRKRNLFLALVFSLAIAMVSAACADGTNGAQGAQGTGGDRGAQGAEGPVGPQGAGGLTGLAGEDGASGEDAPQPLNRPDRNGPANLVVKPATVTVGETTISVLGSGWAPNTSVTTEFHRLFYAKSQVVRARPMESSTYKFVGGRSNESGAFKFDQTEAFTQAVEIYFDEIKVDEAVFTVIARSSNGDEASFPVTVKRSASSGSVGEKGN